MGATVQTVATVFGELRLRLWTAAGSAWIGPAGSGRTVRAGRIRPAAARCPHDVAHASGAAMTHGAEGDALSRIGRIDAPGPADMGAKFRRWPSPRGKWGYVCRLPRDRSGPGCLGWAARAGTAGTWRPRMPGDTIGMANGPAAGVASPFRIGCIDRRIRPGCASRSRAGGCGPGRGGTVSAGGGVNHSRPGRPGQTVRTGKIGSAAALAPRGETAP